MKKLLCIDSDGCVLHTMDYKHIHAFGPLFVAHFTPFVTSDETVLQQWISRNLYEETRGMNRFVGAYECLKVYKPEMDGFREFETFINETPALSHSALVSYATTHPSVCIEKVIAWSCDVNNKIQTLEGEATLFQGVKEILTRLSNDFDLAVVSSANKSALTKEWEHFGLRSLCTYFFSQEEGTKSECIKKLLEKGYAVSDVLMIGDALGDELAARNNQVYFAPILAKREVESWQWIEEEVVALFKNDNITSQQQKEWIEKMKENFKGEK